MLRHLTEKIEPWHIAVATLVLSVLAVLIIVLLNSGRVPADTLSVGSEPVRNEWANADSLLPADDFSAGIEPEWIPFRPRRTRWPDDRVQEHWIDPAPVGRELLDERVEQRMEGIFQEVP